MKRNSRQIDVERLKRERAEKAGAKYLLSDGRNEGEVRDNTLDILEELTDALTILEILKERAVISEVVAYEIYHLRSDIWDAIRICEFVREELNESYLIEDVERIGVDQEEIVNDIPLSSLTGRTFLAGLQGQVQERIKAHSDAAGETVAVDITTIAPDDERHKYWDKGYAAAMVDLAETLNGLLRRMETQEVLQ